MSNNTTDYQPSSSLGAYIVVLTSLLKIKTCKGPFTLSKRKRKRDRESEITFSLMFDVVQ